MTELQVGFEIECGLDLPRGMSERGFREELESIGFEFTRDAHFYDMDVCDLEAITMNKGRTDYMSHLDDFIQLMNRMREYKSEPLETGLHINISPAGSQFFGQETLANILLIYLKLEEELYSLVPDERKENTHSGIYSTAAIEELKSRIKGMSINNFQSGRFEQYIRQKNQEVGLKYAGLGFHHLCKHDEEDKRIEFRFFDAKLKNLKRNTKIAINIIKQAINNTTYEIMKKIDKVKNGNKTIEEFLHL